MMVEISSGTDVARAIAAPPVEMPARMMLVKKMPIGLYPDISAAFSPIHA